MATNSLQAESVSANPPVSWQAAVTTWRAAIDAYANHPYPRATTQDPNHDALEREAGVLSDIEARALDAVIDMPAPDHAALVEKLKIIRSEFSNDDFYMDKLIADVQRLGDL